MAQTYDLTGGSTAKLTPGPTVLRSAVISVVGCVADDVWEIFRLPAGARVLAANVETVDNGVANSLYDVGYDGLNEIANDVAGDASAVTNAGLDDRLESPTPLTVKAVTMATSPAAGSFRVTALVAQM